MNHFLNGFSDELEKVSGLKDVAKLVRRSGVASKAKKVVERAEERAWRRPGVIKRRITKPGKIKSEEFTATRDETKHLFGSHRKRIKNDAEKAHRPLRADRRRIGSKDVRRRDIKEGYRRFSKFDVHGRLKRGYSKETDIFQEPYYMQRMQEKYLPRYYRRENSKAWRRGAKRAGE